MRAAGAVALAVLGAARPAAASQEPPWRELSPIAPVDLEHLAPGPNTGAHLAAALAAFRQRGGFADLQVLLNAVTLHHPERARLFAYGESAGGRPLLALELGPAAAPARRATPRLLVCADLSGSARGAAEAAVEVVVQLLEEIERGGELAGAASWIVVPAPLPDGLEGRLEGRAPASGVDPATDFPGDWDPWGPGSGPYPLALPETRALASLVGAAGPAGALLAGDLGDARGGPGLAGFCERELGLPPRRVDALACGGEIGDALAGALGDLPALAFGEPRVERLGEELWLVEVALENRGPAGRGRAAGARLEWEGARVLAASEATDPAGPFRALAGARSGASLEPLDGGSSRALRLVVAGGAAGRLALVAAAGRAAGCRAEIVLGSPEPR